MIRTIWWCCAARTMPHCIAGGCASTGRFRPVCGSAHADGTVYGFMPSPLLAEASAKAFAGLGTRPCHNVGMVERGWVLAGACFLIGLGCGRTDDRLDGQLTGEGGASDSPEITGGTTNNGAGAVTESSGGSTRGGAGNAEGHCGDGHREGLEECDDGNANNEDDCLNDCILASCGDGVIHWQGTGTEICDDGEENGPAPAICGTNCGFDAGWMDGIVDPWEQCDDANRDDSDSCVNTNRWNICGDEFLYLTRTEGTNNPNELEECDDSNLDETDPCTNSCKWNVCGDGFLFQRGYGESYETDDDGNPMDDNPHELEACDDGNVIGGDGCDGNCRVEGSF
jgi:cysteine-rich repeat protein